MSDNKVIVLGIDGMDPKMTRRLVDEGRLPNIEKLIKQGGARHDLVLIGRQCQPLLRQCGPLWLPAHIQTPMV